MTTCPPATVPETAGNAIKLDDREEMIPMNEWSFHVQQRDHLRLMAHFATNRDLSQRYEQMAFTHARLARRALAAPR